jgi:hypothetical protein
LVPSGTETSSIGGAQQEAITITLSGAWIASRSLSWAARARWLAMTFVYFGCSFSAAELMQ